MHTLPIKGLYSTLTYNFSYSDASNKGKYHCTAATGGTTEESYKLNLNGNLFFNIFLIDFIFRLILKNVIQMENKYNDAQYAIFLACKK